MSNSSKPSAATTAPNRTPSPSLLLTTPHTNPSSLPLSYWDEPLDSGSFSKSIIFDPETGFGGDGVAPSYCIQDGPFAGYVNGIGPGHLVKDHCIDRQINDAFSILTHRDFVESCYEAESYERAWPCLEGFPHAGGHGGVGREVSSLVTLPLTGCYRPRQS